MSGRAGPYSSLVSDPRILRTLYDLVKGRGLVINYSKEGIEGSFTRPAFPSSQEDLGDFLNKQRAGVGYPGLHVTHAEYKATPKFFGDTGTRRAFHFFLDVDGRRSLEPARRVVGVMADELGRMEVPHWVKFSGNTGFHIHIPSSAFPPRTDGKDFLTVAPRLFLDIKHMLIRRAAERAPESLLGTVIHPKRYYGTTQGIQRLPLSLHEATGLVSLPLRDEEIGGFDPLLSGKPEATDVSERLVAITAGMRPSDGILSMLEEDRRRPIPFYHRR